MATPWGKKGKNAPKRAKLHSPGQRPGQELHTAKRPTGATIKNNEILKLPLSGRIAHNHIIPRALPWAVEELSLQGAVVTSKGIGMFNRNIPLPYK